MKPLLSFVLLFTVLATAHAEVELAPIFRDHAVLQRDKPLPVWGTAAPGEDITVTFKGASAKTKADQQGRWKVELAPLPASKEPADLVVTGKNVFTVKDVLVGEVWFCSGQSNMAFHVAKTENAGEEIRTANFPLIRAYSVPRKVSETPVAESAGEWRSASPDTVNTFSAVAFYFGRDLYRRLDVPIGLITSSWGGTFIESWMSPESLASIPLGKTVAERWKEALANYPELKAKYDVELVQWEAAEAAAKKSGKKFTKRQPWKPSARGSEDTPSGLYHAMVHPFLPYAIRGVLWYQGESNVSRAGEYAELMTAWIKGWRSAFAQGDIPFYWVQLPKYGFAQKNDWARLREAQSKVLSLPATGQVVTVDLPLDDPKNKHPMDKQTVCKRLALLAAAQLYGAKEEFSGPRFEKMERKGEALRISFQHAEGLTARMTPLTGFEIAGADQKFHVADARVEGSQVVVSSPSVPAPVAVRYAYNNYPEIGLFNGAGLPAEPFRTDDWSLENPQ